MLGRNILEGVVVYMKPFMIFLGIKLMRFYLKLILRRHIINLNVLSFNRFYTRKDSHMNGVI
jgi:hypothetical protein